MDEPIEEVYFNWLYSKVAAVEVPTPALTHYQLLRTLHSIEFVWLLSGDDNRAEEGLDLRKEFFRAARIPEDPVWMGIGCSVLEMIIAFTRRAEFETDIPAREWFWTILENMRLAHLNDSRQNVSRTATLVVDRFVWRTYRRDGLGGMFPLKSSANDQRKVEIWYQFCEYLEEHNII